MRSEAVFMANAPKYAQVMSVIERRVRKGDYLLRNIPANGASPRKPA
jgi:hypothetical protein